MPIKKSWVRVCIVAINFLFSLQAMAKVKPLEFPRDEGHHLSAGLEWWYFTGHLKTIDGQGQKQNFGYFVTFFHSFGRPVALHASINDFQNAKFYSYRKILNPLSRCSSAKKLSIDLGERAKVETLGDFSYLLKMKIDEKRSLDLVLTSKNKSFQLHDNTGHFSVGNVGNYYYSLTNLLTTGVLFIDGQRLNVEGTSWYDHQYGNIWQAGLDFKESYFLAAQLDNSKQINAFRVVDKKGHVVMTHAKVVDAQGQVHSLGEGVELIKNKTIISAKTGNQYPVDWDFNFLDPQDGTYTQCRLWVDHYNQELTSQSLIDRLPNYFEGRGRVECLVDDQEKRSEISGGSYIETLNWDLFRIIKTNKKGRI